MQENLQEIIKKGAIVVDVRTPEEFNNGHIAGSINIPVNEIGNALSWLQKDVPMVLVCASGVRSAHAKFVLDSNGFLEVYNGGAWNSLGNVHAGGCPVK